MRIEAIYLNEFSASNWMLLAQGLELSLIFVTLYGDESQFL